MKTQNAKPMSASTLIEQLNQKTAPGAHLIEAHNQARQHLSDRQTVSAGIKWRQPGRFWCRRWVALATGGHTSHSPAE